MTGSSAPDPQVSLALSRYLLPRVIELLAQGREVANVGIEASLRRFATGLPDRWTTPEADVINRFTLLFVDSHKPGGRNAQDCYLDDILCMFASAGHEPSPLLEHLWSWDDADLFGRLAQDWNFSGGHPSIWSTAFWPESEWSLPGQAERATRVAEWYRSPEMVERLERAKNNSEVDGELNRQAAWVLDVLTAN